LQEDDASFAWPEAMRQAEGEEVSCHPKERVTPSDAGDGPDTTAGLGRIERYGTTLGRKDGMVGVDEGTAYHDAFAFMVANGGNPLADGIIGKDMADAIRSTLVLVERLWPGARLHAEVPLTASADCLDDGLAGQYVEARIDLLVETDSGFAIIDHKLTEQPVADLAKFASKHARQLSFYRSAIGSLAGKPVLGTFLNLPQEGVMCEITGAR